MFYRCLRIEEQLLIDSRIHAQALNRLQVITIPIPLDIGERAIVSHCCGRYWKIHCMITRAWLGKSERK
jgi:hypothetical protein